jgi:mono/diheme cytochrome c family protein
MKAASTVLVATLLAGLTFLGTSPAAFAADPAKPIDVSKIPLPVARAVDFEKEVYPMLKESCFSCHGPEKQKGKYRCDTKAGAFKDTDYGPTIVPGKSEKSALIHMVCGLIDEMLMPPPSDKKGQSEPLTKEQIGILRAWIDQGAKWPEGNIKDFVKPVTFATDLLPLFSTACAPCHSGASAKGNFDASSLEGVLRGGKSYGKVVTPADLKQSTLLTIVSGQDEDLPQPEKHKLQPKQIEIVRKWIEQGAK